MVEFEKVLNTAMDGYNNRDDYPPFALTSWDDRNKFIEYLKKINKELKEEVGNE